MNNLLNTKAYLIGAIENDDNAYDWRADLKNRLSDFGIKFFDPLRRPLINKVEENAAFKTAVKNYRKDLDIVQLHDVMSKIRSEDLSLVDRCDFIVFYLDLNKPTCGSYEEYFRAIWLNKPAYIVCPQGLDKIPLWLFGCESYSRSYFFNDFVDLKIELRNVDGFSVHNVDKKWNFLALDCR